MWLLGSVRGRRVHAAPAAPVAVAAARMLGRDRVPGDARRGCGGGRPGPVVPLADGRGVVRWPRSRGCCVWWWSWLAAGDTDRRRVGMSVAEHRLGTRTVRRASPDAARVAVSGVRRRRGRRAGVG